MNHEEAKLILQAYRPGGEDAADPQFLEALELARLDPELGAWLAREQDLDARIGTKVRESFRPPSDLQSRLLAECRIVRTVSWWRRPAWQLAAACLAVLLVLGGVGVVSERQRGFPAYRETMANFAARDLDRLDLMSHDLAEIRHWLSDNKADGELVLPEGLNGRPALGCRVFEWRHHTVTLVCFDLGNHQVAHLLVIDSASIKDPPNGSPVFDQVGFIATVGWSRNGKTYLVASWGASQLDLMKIF